MWWVIFNFLRSRIFGDPLAHPPIPIYHYLNEFWVSAAWSLKLVQKHLLICSGIKRLKMIQPFYIQKVIQLSRGFLVKKAFVKISQNSQENTCARASFLIKLQAELLFNRTRLAVASVYLLIWFFSEEIRNRSMIEIIKTVK